MLIIGHRGAAGTTHENSLASLHAGLDADADMIEFDIRLTKDGVPVLLHDGNLWRTHRIPYFINRIKFKDVQKRTHGSDNPILSFKEALKIFSGNILLNFDLKAKGSAEKIMPELKKYIKKPADWDLFLFASRHASELRYIRKFSKRANLSLIHTVSPLSFLLYNRQLDLTAVGFHRLHINAFTVGAAKRLKLFTYVYTVNRTQTAERMMELGIDGIVTDYPHKLTRHFKKLNQLRITDSKKK